MDFTEFNGNSSERECVESECNIAAEALRNETKDDGGRAVYDDDGFSADGCEDTTYASGVVSDNDFDGDASIDGASSDDMLEAEADELSTVSVTVSAFQDEFETNNDEADSETEAADDICDASESGTAAESAEEQAADSENGAKRSYDVISVSFKKSGKDYYFDSMGEKYSRGDNIIVETSRGTEYGTVISGNRIVSEREVVLPLRPVLRRATEADEQIHRENLRKEIDAYNACVEKIAKHGLEMKLVDVEYTFDNSKLIFYFTAEGRVDFRELVKDLASMFRTRIELRQIGIRDEAKLMGGLGICGRPFCCHSFLSDFVQVSIKMAKEQNLSLNSSKTSGACGRLMCCLRYEYDVYCEEIKKTPKLDAVVETPDGEGIVKETMPLTGKIRVEIRKKHDTSVKVYSRDDVTVVQGKTAKEYIAEKNAELERLEASRPERQERPERKPMPKPDKAATIEEAENRRAERAAQARARIALADREADVADGGQVESRGGAGQRREGRPQRDRRGGRGRENRDGREQRGERDNREPRESRENREQRENRDNREPRENREHSENRDSRETREWRESRDNHDNREQRECRDRRRGGRGRRGRRGSGGSNNSDGQGNAGQNGGQNAGQGVAPEY